MTVHKIGLKLDALVSSKIMGQDPSKTPLEYSSNIEFAWSVVEKMYDLGYGYVLERAHDVPTWTVHFIPNKPVESAFFHFVEDMEKISMESKSLPQAICNAALKCMNSR